MLFFLGMLVVIFNIAFDIVSLYQVLVLNQIALLENDSLNMFLIDKTFSIVVCLAGFYVFWKEGKRWKHR